MTTTDPDLLNGWKEIAAYLRISPKTARRWEMNDNLPILSSDRRHKGPVFARKSALDAWLQGTLQKVALEDDRLVALGRSDRILWTYRFPGTLSRFTSEELAWRLLRVDLHGEGKQGVLVTARFLVSSTPDTLCFFSADGKLEWTLEADPQLLDRDGSSFEQAWMFKHVIVASTSRGQFIWAALANAAGWAGCVLRVDFEGKATVQFANAGHVEWLCHVASPNEDCLIACGENNAFDQSFVALLGVDDPPCSSAPGGRPRYRYGNAPDGTPRKYILFPRTELIAARQKPYGHASRMRQFPQDIIVEVETGAEGGYFLYHFSRQLEPKYTFPSGSHEFRHRDLERSGHIGHSWEECPELEQPLTLNVWEPTVGWHDASIRWRDNPWRERW